MSPVVAIVQARMGSRRLPGKVLLDIAGVPMLWHVVQRARRATTLHHVLVATSTATADDAVAAWCASTGVACWRGSEHDVLDRYYQAARQEEADVVVRLTADCPLLDPEVIDEVVTCFLTGTYDYVSNVAPPTFPDGLDTEVMSFATLQRAWQEARQPAEREHVTPYVRQHPELFRLANVTHSPDLSGLRWTVDEAADLRFVRAVYSSLSLWERAGGEGLYRLANLSKAPHPNPLPQGEGRDFGLHDICALLASQPDLGQINSHLARHAGYARSVQEEERR
jgi:spore coat polysaccharide biosynthesis protein SpsF (cytidylyltransferase family)